MPIARVQLPDGRIGRFEVPEGTTPEQVEAFVLKATSAQNAPEQQRPFELSGEKTSDPSGFLGQFGFDPKALGITPAENIAGHPITRFALGAASPFLKGTKLVAELLGDTTGTETLNRLDELQRRGQTAQGGGEFDALGLAGTVVSPAVLGISRALKPAKTILGKAAQGVAVGAGFGALAPVKEGEDLFPTTAAQAGAGALFGGVVAPAAGLVSKGFSGVVSGVKSLLNSAPAKLAARAAGDKVDDVIAALRNQQSGVPGVNLTAGQASVPANSAEFAALQNAVASRDPSRFFGPAGVEGQQQAARLASLRTVSRTPKKLANAVTARKTQADVNYGEAFEQSIKADPKLTLMALNPFFKEALPDATRVAVSRGITPKNNLTEFLQLVKFGLDKQLRRSGNESLDKAEKEAVLTLQKQLVDWLRRKNTAFKRADTAFIKASRPINQMKLGQEVEQALVSPLGSERAASFNQAVRKASNTVSKATGRPRIEDLTPKQRSVIQAIEDNLKNDDVFRKLAQKGAANLDERISSTVVPPTGIFMPILSAARSVSNRILGKINEKTLRELAPLLENPRQLAELMAVASPQQRVVIQAVFQQRALALTGAFGASQSEGQASP